MKEKLTFCLIIIMFEFHNFALTIEGFYWVIQSICFKKLILHENLFQKTVIGMSFFLHELSQVLE